MLDGEVLSMTMPKTVEDYHLAMDNYKQKYTIVSIKIITHGELQTGKVILINDGKQYLTASIQDLDVKQSGGAIGNPHIVFMQCYARHDPSAGRGNKLLDRQTGRNVSVVSQEGDGSWNIPRSVLEKGREGWMHTGLNPEVMDYPAVVAVVNAELSAEVAVI